MSPRGPFEEIRDEEVVPELRSIFKRLQQQHGLWIQDDLMEIDAIVRRKIASTSPAVDEKKKKEEEEKEISFKFEEAERVDMKEGVVVECVKVFASGFASGFMMSFIVVGVLAVFWAGR